jgi:iron complex transport system substrate-binding protein
MSTTPSVRRRRPITVALLAALLLVLGAAACGSDSGSSSSTTTGSGSSSSSGSSGSSFEPVSVEHLYGTTEIAERPERIVSLDTQWTDVLTALGSTPVGYLADEREGVLPWQDGMLDESTALTGGTVLPFEQIAALDPDLIVITYFLPSESDYALLSDIAPTIATLNPDGNVDTWQSIAEVAGQVLGDEDAATDLVADVDGQVAAVAEEMPQLEEATFAFANYIEGDAIYVLTDPNDGANILFTQLGMVIPESLQALGGGEAGRAQLSLEQISMLDAELLMMLTQGADPANIAGYAQLPAVQAGTVQIMDYPLAVALNTPTPLSIPYALELVEPTLAKVGA